MSLVTAGPEFLSDAASDAVASAFIARVALAAAATAQAVLSESTSVTNHAGRAAYARQVQANPLVVSTNEIAWAVVSDMATGTGSNDQLILDRIASLWDNLAYGY